MALVGSSNLKRVKISEVLTRFKRALYEGLDWDEHRVKIRATNAFTPTPIDGNQIIWLQCQAPVPHPDFAGAERLELVVTRILEVHIMTYLQLDPVDSEETLLTDPDLGHYELEDEVIDIIEQRLLLDTTESMGITIEPLKYIAPFARDKEIPFAAGKPLAPGWDKWVESVIPFMVVYSRDRDTRAVEITNEL